MDYTDEMKRIAIERYIVNDKNASKTVKELGYPTVQGLIKWYYDIFHQKPKEPARILRSYTEEEKNRGIELYFKNDKTFSSLTLSRYFATLCATVSSRV